MTTPVLRSNTLIIPDMSQDKFPPNGNPPDGYVIAFSAVDGYYVARPSTRLLIQTNPTVAPAGSYNYLTEDAALITHSGTGTINLPTSPPAGTVARIKDFSGNCATQNLTVSSAQLIDGAATYVINTNFGEVTVVFTGATWWIMAKF